MEKRKEKILNIIIREHIKTAAPVGSGIVVEKYKLNVSPATVRNEMAELEEEGYIVQPYTSAGRIPTEKAYNLHLTHLKEKKLNGQDEKNLAGLLGGKNEADFRSAAKILSQKTGEAVFWAFQKNNLYYTGVSNLLAQPEFVRSNLIYDVSLIIDRMDEIIEDIFDGLKYGPHVLIGSENPFSNFCSTVMAKYKSGSSIGLFGVLGPMRMDYEKNLSLVNFINKEINNSY